MCPISEPRASARERFINRKVFVGVVSLVGLTLVGVSALTTRPEPGNLQALEPSLTWRSSTGKKFQPLSSDDAQATFHLRNSGGLPVRILNFSSTCGCAVPAIDSMVIGPGVTKDLIIQATPVQIGSRHVNITIFTDSKVSPQVEVRLDIFSDREPPYMTQARGDLTFAGDAKDGNARLIMVDSIEKKGSHPMPPLIKNNLPFIEIREPLIHKEELDSSSDVVHRIYTFEARLKVSEKVETTSGEIFVVDPWDSSHVQTIYVHQLTTPPLKVIPQRTVLTVGGDLDGHHPEAKFMVLSKEPIADLVVELEGDGKKELSLTKTISSADNRRFTFVVGLRTAILSGTMYHVQVGRSSSSDRIRVPIAIRNEANP